MPHREIDRLFQRALRNFHSGKVRTAEREFRKILEATPTHSGSLNLLGVLLMQQKRFTEAVSILETTAFLNGMRSPASIYNYGVALLEAGRHSDALTQFDLLAHHAPDDAEIWHNRGVALHRLSKLGAAVESFDKAISIRSDFADAIYSRANTKSDLKQFDGAFEDYDRAITLKPGFVEALCNKAHALNQAQRYEDALAACKEALESKPECAEAYNHRGLALQGLHRYDDAFADFDNALMIRPDYVEPLWNKAFLHLLLGNFADGLPLYESRRKLFKHADFSRNFAAPSWRGKGSLHGKRILLFAEQGLGDTILAFRYVKLLSAKGVRIILEVQQPLVSLLKSQDEALAIFAKGDSLPAFDLQCPLMSLPLAFESRVDTIPAEVPYIKAAPKLAAKWRDRLGATKLRVGVVWAGNPSFHSDHTRSIGLKALSPIFLTAGISFFSLQKDLRLDDDAIAGTYRNLEQLGPSISDFSDTAAILSSLDLVISSDTSVAHLAGALGCPVWIALKHSPDWRWLLHRDDSLWYPTARLFRQPVDGDWRSVVEAIRGELERLVGKR